MRKLSETFKKFSVSFEDSDNVLKLVTKAVDLFQNHENKVERQDHPAERRKEFNDMIHHCQ